MFKANQFLIKKREFSVDLRSHIYIMLILIIFKMSLRNMLSKSIVSLLCDRANLPDCGGLDTFAKDYKACLHLQNYCDLYKLNILLYTFLLHFTEKICLSRFYLKCFNLKDSVLKYIHTRKMEYLYMSPFVLSENILFFISRSIALNFDWKIFDKNKLVLLFIPKKLRCTFFEYL